MITLTILGNFKGTTKEYIQTIVLSLLLDSIYLAPFINGLLKH